MDMVNVVTGFQLGIKWQRRMVQLTEKLHSWPSKCRNYPCLASSSLSISCFSRYQQTSLCLLTHDFMVMENDHYLLFNFLIHDKISARKYYLMSYAKTTWYVSSLSWNIYCVWICSVHTIQNMVTFESTFCNFSLKWLCDFVPKNQTC